ncbi:MAG: N-acetylneuraminate synthase family protein [Candidatus Heimdallarchaeota archaeon]
MKSFKVGQKNIGDSHPTYIVGEMAWSHDGSIDKAKAIIKACADANCDAINFHVTSLDNYMIPDYRRNDKISAFDGLKKLTIPMNQWSELFEYTRKLGLQISALCNDVESAKVVKKLEPDVCMFHASCLTEKELIKAIAKIGKPVFFAVGGSTIDEILQAIQWLNEDGCDEIGILFGMQNYPTKLEDNNANYLRTLKKMFERPIGFSDHTDAEDPLALIVPLMGIPLGANIIEKHITYDRSAKGTDYHAALNPKEMKTFVDYVRRIETIFGSGTVRAFSDAEKSYRQTVRKRIVAIKDLKSNHILSEADVRAMRSDKGIAPDRIEDFVGKKINKNIKKFDPITDDLFY